MKDTGPSYSPVAPDSTDAFGVVAAMEWLRRHRRALVAIPLVSVAAVVVLVFVVPSRYTSATVILPQAKGSTRLPSSLAGLAGQLGMSLPGESGQSPQFYAEAATSRALLTGLLRERFADSTRPRGATLLEILDPSGSTDALRLENGIKKLRKRLTTATNGKSGTLTIAFEGPSPQLAKDVLDSLVAGLNRLNLQTLRTQASEKRRFLATRKDAAWGDLQAASLELQHFYDANRVWESAPQLRFREKQLRDRMDSRQQLYTGIEREYESARIQEFDEVPVFSVVDPPFAPAKRSFPKRTVWVLFGAVVSLLATVAGIVVLEYLRAVTGRRRPAGAALTAAAGRAYTPPPAAGSRT